MSALFPSPRYGKTLRVHSELVDAALKNPGIRILYGCTSVEQAKETLDVTARALQARRDGVLKDILLAERELVLTNDARIMFRVPTEALGTASFDFHGPRQWRPAVDPGFY